MLSDDAARELAAALRDQAAALRDLAGAIRGLGAGPGDGAGQNRVAEIIGDGAAATRDDAYLNDKPLISTTCDNG